MGHVCRDDVDRFLTNIAKMTVVLRVELDLPRLVHGGRTHQPSAPLALSTDLSQINNTPAQHRSVVLQFWSGVFFTVVLVWVFTAVLI